MIKKFDKDDILHNVLIANPKVSFRIFAGSVYSNRGSRSSLRT